MSATVYRDICGTTRGYNKHNNTGEECCQPCKEVGLAHKRGRRAGTIEPGNATAEIVEEIEWMFRQAQGQYYVIQAIGYQGREIALKRRLQRAGRHDLASRLLNADQEAA